MSHAGVELLVAAVHAKEVQLDGESVVDLLQVASYLQVSNNPTHVSWRNMDA